MSEYKKIVLLKGFEVMDDYHFRTIKSLLRKELNLTKKLQDEYDRIQVADIMEDTFPQDAGLDKLIKVCEGIKELEDLAKKLKKEKAKVKKQKKEKTKTAVKKAKQDEPSSSQSLPTDDDANNNKDSLKKKRKIPTKSEGGNKKKLTQETTQLPEPSQGSTQTDQGWLQPPQKPPPTPSSSSTNKKQKNTGIKNHSTITTEVPQKKHQLQELSANDISSAASELQSPQGLSSTASRSIKTPCAPPLTGFTSKKSHGSPGPPSLTFPISPASNSSMHQNFPVPLTLSSAVQAPSVSSATPSSSVGVPHMPSETVSSSLNAPQMSPVSVPSSTQNLCPPTAVAFNSMQAPPSSQILAPRSVQTPRVPSATLKRKAQDITTSPATASINVQVPHTLPEAVSRNACTTQVPLRAPSSDIQTLNWATVRAPRNTKVPGPLDTVPIYFLALPSPATTASSLQTSQVLPPPTSKSLAAPQVPLPIETSRVQTTQMHPGAAANFTHPLHAPPVTGSKSVGTTQVPPGVVAPRSGQALPCPKEKSSRNVQAPQMPSATTSSSLLSPRVCPTPASSSLRSSLVPQATTKSSPYRTLGRGNIPKEPSKEEGHQQGPKEVMVLKVTEPFTYDLIKDLWMFHATVATETEFFRVKVFDLTLKDKFIPKKIISISDYFGANGFLEIHKAACVSDVNVNQTMVISNALKQRANATPKIKDLFSQTKGTYVNGEFMVFTKTERNNFIYYGIEDDTGKMEVVVYGRLTSIKCEPGNKLRLVCFELSSSEDTWQLKSVRHSYMQVINVKKKLHQH
ncbi:pyrin domain-containing protein 3 isoform X1 [Cricetulus griseus]|nr:pyrin domain-containing protein 3 isoform X1 [Cricetulus griseus]XP_007639186.1 pyrin domain-containing protein 3 isoform X1 [Cricetulus griseus]XP_035310310.1 pyrin domain-containing protein 3 isoform X1 [Cricetulus griseus]